jgi:hypothetical protein
VALGATETLGLAPLKQSLQTAIDDTTHQLRPVRSRAWATETLGLAPLKQSLQSAIDDTTHQPCPAHSHAWATETLGLAPLKQSLQTAIDDTTHQRPQAAAQLAKATPTEAVGVVNRGNLEGAV